MNISLDFDNTFTKDPALWAEFTKRARNAGHRVYCVTMRTDKPSQADEVRERIGPHVDHIVFTDYKAKAPHMERLGITIHIWIDDAPQCIHENMEPWP